MKIELLYLIKMVTKNVLFGFLLLCLFFTTLMANNIHAQIKPIDKTFVRLNKSEWQLQEIFKNIENSTDYKFVYSEDILREKTIINSNKKRESVNDILAAISNSSRLKFKQVNNTIYVGDISNEKDKSQIEKEEIEVSGTVTDEKGIPLPGASITIAGTTIGTVTDLEGQYSLSVPEGSTMVFSFIGFETQRIAIEAQSVIDVVMLDDTSSLDEVVVVGYGTQKAYSIVGSITTIDPKTLQTGTNRSLSNNLAGRLAGVVAVQRSGEPGYDNSNFWIRGISTFAGNRNPLVLVDGVERSLNNIDPAEIETFSILKDASASAVYGVRGANGVILINTKRGQAGKPEVNLRYEQGFTRPVKLPEFVAAPEYLEVFNSIARENGTTEPYSEERINNIRNQVDPDLYPDVNWLDAVTEDYALNRRLNLTVSGGSEILRYALVASNYHEDGIISRDKRQDWDSSMKLDRYNIRSNVDINITPSTLFRINIGGYLQDEYRAPQSIDNLFAKAFETPPFVHPTQYSSGEIPVTPQRANPWALATQTGYQRSSSSKIESLFSVEQDLSGILPGLEVIGKFSFDRYSRNSVIRSKNPDYYNPAVGRLEDGSLNLVIDSYGQDFLGHTTGSEWGDKSVYIEGNLTYRKTFKKHDIDAMFLYNQRNYDNGGRLPYLNQGIAGRASYSYDHRFIAEVNFGYNGSENFAKGQRFGFFPSIAVGWLISEEEFMQRYSNTISKLKIRASHGKVGNDQIDGRRFAYITTIGDTDGYSWGVDNDYYRAGRREGDYGVPNLTWESVAKSNIGVELTLLNSIDLTVDFFKEKRSDIFMQRKTIPGSSGFIQTPWANYGEVENKGMDASLQINKQLSSDFSISIWGNFTYVVNKIVEQDEPSSIIGTNRSSTGKPIGQIFGLLDDGLFTNEDFDNIDNGTLNESVPSHTFGPVRPGDIKYVDINQDGIINDLDRTAIGGTVDPQIVYGMGLNITYKQIDLGLFFQGNARTNRVIGGSFFIPGTGGGSLGNIYSNVSDRWTIENPQQDVFWPRLSNQTHSNNNQSSTWWLKNMSVLRLKNIEFGYSLPQNWVKEIGIKSTRIFVRGDNLLTFSDFDLWDPEVDTNNGFRYPIMKSVSWGLDINF